MSKRKQSMTAEQKELANFGQTVLGNPVAEARTFLRHFDLGDNPAGLARLTRALERARRNGCVIKDATARYEAEGGIGHLALFQAWLRELPVEYPAYAEKVRAS